MELEDYIRQMDTMMENYTTGTSTYPLTSNEVILTTTSEPNWVMYTQGYRHFQEQMERTVFFGTPNYQSPIQNFYKNYSVREVSFKNRTEFIVTTRSGRKISKIVNKNMIEKERADLYKGRVIGYKEYWENI